MEHHSNIVPWQLVCEQTGARVLAAPITDDGEVDLAAMADLITERTKVVAVTHVSNALGTVNDIAAVVRLARARSKAAVVVDGAQAVPHMDVDVSALGCDFYAFSGHKMYGPGGIGALWGRGELLASMPPYHGGGAMITRVTFERTEYAAPPQRFEAGTPAIAPAIGLGVAVEFLESIGLERIEQHEQELLSHSLEQLNDLPWVRVLGQSPAETASVASRRRVPGDRRRTPPRCGNDPGRAGDRHPGRSSLRPAADGAARCSRPPCAPRSACTTPTRKSTGSPLGCTKCGGSSAERLYVGSRISMSDLRDLYQQVILDHYRAPRNFGALEPVSSCAEGYNPLCGDKVKVYLKTDGNRVEGLSFEGVGCAISTASASLMTEAVLGLERAQAEALLSTFLAPHDRRE